MMLVPSAAAAATVLLGLGLGLGPLLSPAGAYEQGSESDYLANYAATTALSYAAVDDPAAAPLGLLAECKDAGQASLMEGSETVLQPDGTGHTVSASSAQAQCGATPSSVCVVPAGLSLVMSSNLNIQALTVRGEVYWRDSDQSNAEQYLCAGYVAVEDNGKFIMNLSDGTKNGWVYIKDNGAVHPVGRTRFFGGAVGHSEGHHNSGVGPTVAVTGRPMVRTWSLLSDPFLTGDSALKLLHSPMRMGWRVGDRIGVASTRPSSGGTGQTFRIIGLFDDGTITLDGSANDDRRAEFLPPVKSGDPNFADPYSAALLSAEVVNLSRNIVITGDDLTHVDCDPNLPEAVLGEQTSTQGCRCASYRNKCTVGLHTAQMHAGTMSVRNARVEKCGQRGIEGKYCLHFHKLSDCPNCVFENNAVEFGHQRGIIVHGTHRSTVENNVIWDVRGAGIYIEDGNEMHNAVKYNVVACPWMFTDTVLHGCTVPGTSNTQADTSLNQAGIYTETAANDLIGNRVSNSFNGMLLQANGQGRGETYGKVCTNHLEFGRWEGNTFHGHLRFGTYTLGGSEPRDTDQSIANNGYNTDRDATCAAMDGEGNDRGAPVSILNNVDYDNVFVGHYTAGDIQHRGHKSVGSNNLIYWKETKNFADGCAAHISDAYYESGTMALPDQGTFIIQDTTFGGDILLEANHHCNVGTTGFLCMPQYILHNVRWKGGRSGTWVWLQRGGTGGGGVFSLSPPNAADIEAATAEEQAAMQDMIFLPGYVSLASGHFTYLLSATGDRCAYAADMGFGTRYDGGILCKVPLRVLKVWSRGLTPGSAPALRVEVWFDALNGIAGQSTDPPSITQLVEFHATGGSGDGKQGYSLPVIPRTDVSYRLSLTPGDGNIPSDWIIEFSDPVMGNRWVEEFVQLSVQGRDCGADGLVSSQHDRRHVGGLIKDAVAWGNHGACVGQSQPATMDAIDCTVAAGGKAGAVALTKCPELCAPACDGNNSFCHCGAGICECKPGFAGADCSIDLCAAARCGEHGTCAALYLGDTSALPVTSPDHACICDDGWFGALCDQPDPCLSSNRTCSGRGACASNGYVDYCECDEGYSGENCENGCDSVCAGGGGVYPYGCADAIDGVVTYKCGPTGGCQYLAEGNPGHESWCTYKDATQQVAACECPTSNDCEVVGPCNADGSCPAPTQVSDGTPCNSKPFGLCEGGVCVEPPTPAPTANPTHSPVTAAPMALAISVPAPVTTPTAAPASPLVEEDCEGKCAGNPPHFGCAGGAMEGKVAYKCDPNGGGGCQYLSAGQESQWCTYKVFMPLPPAPVEAPTPSPTNEPTDAPMQPLVQENCEGKCSGEPPHFGCAGWPMEDRVAYKCDPNGGGGCQYLSAGQESQWCTYKVFTPSTPAPVEAPTPSPTNEPMDAPMQPPVQENCEGKCSGEPPHFGCAGGAMEGKVAYKCDPNGGGGCQYLSAGQESSWCTYKVFP